MKKTPLSFIYEKVAALMSSSSKGTTSQVSKAHGKTTTIRGRSNTLRSVVLVIMLVGMTHFGLLHFFSGSHAILFPVALGVQTYIYLFYSHIITILSKNGHRYNLFHLEEEVKEELYWASRPNRLIGFNIGGFLSMMYCYLIWRSIGWMCYCPFPEFMATGEVVFSPYRCTLIITCAVVYWKVFRSWMVPAIEEWKSMLEPNSRRMYQTLSVLLASICPKEAPLILVPFLVIIEMISHVVRPIALGLRIGINVLVGHGIMEALSIATGLLKFGTSPALFVLYYFIILIEFIIPFIQAYIYITLIHSFLTENGKYH